MDLTGAAWRKSSFSSGNGGACVEVAIIPGATEDSGSLVALRDSKNPAGGALQLTPGGWREITRAVCATARGFYRASTSRAPPLLRPRQAGHVGGGPQAPGGARRYRRQDQAVASDADRA